MIKNSKISVLIGLGITIASALFCFVFSAYFLSDSRFMRVLYDVGVDSMGALICAALFFGCMKQSGDGGRIFRSLIVMVSVCFVANEAMCFALQVPEQRQFYFILCLLSKTIDLFMIFLFYKYIKITLSFKGTLLKISQIVIPVLMIFEMGVILSNIFYPTTFFIDSQGVYQATVFSLAEDIYLAVASVLTVLLIIMSHNPKKQKIAALTFILFPVIEYILLGGQFGNSVQYGMVAMSVIIMYCVIFNDKSNELTSTQLDLQIASKIQKSALPSAAIESVGHLKVNLQGYMLTAKEVGGDFYDYFYIDEKRICFLIADVSGKGTPAALFMMISKTIIKDYALPGKSTAEIFDVVNAKLCENNDGGMFATAWIGILDTQTMELEYTNAGHNHPVFQRKNNPCEELKHSHGLFLAGLEFTSYEKSELQLMEGDRLLLYTDGVTEAHNAKKELYGMERLKNVLERSSDLPGEQILENIVEDINEFSDETPQFDDITMLILSVGE